MKEDLNFIPYYIGAMGIASVILLLFILFVVYTIMI